jgi:hypothetical protein
MEQGKKVGNPVSSTWRLAFQCRWSLSASAMQKGYGRRRLKPNQGFVPRFTIETIADGSLVTTTRRVLGLQMEGSCEYVE